MTLLYLNAAHPMREAMSPIKETDHSCDRDPRSNRLRALARHSIKQLPVRLAETSRLHPPPRINRLAQTHLVDGRTITGPRRLPDRRRHLGALRPCSLAARSRRRITYAADVRGVADLHRERPPMGTRPHRLAMAALVTGMRPQLTTRETNNHEGDDHA